MRSLMKNQPRLFVRMDRCLGCRSCEIACSVAHSKTKTLAGAINESAPPRKRIYVEAASTLKAPLFCRHCEDAPCVSVCPTKALAPDPKSGAVKLENSKCIGCSSCAMACPFGVIQEDGSSQVIVKCDLCPDRTIPACVMACPTRALQLQPEYEKNRRIEAVNRMVEALHAGGSPILRAQR